MFVNRSCAVCEHPRYATKQHTLWSLPNILVVQFKRFCVAESGKREKIDLEIKFPLRDLDMRPYCENEGDYIYDLVAVSNHMGGLENGHCK